MTTMMEGEYRFRPEEEDDLQKAHMDKYFSLEAISKLFAEITKE